jgi:resolvase-like protein
MRGLFISKPIDGLCYDAAVSSADAIDTRPGFAAMLKRVESNGVRTIIVETASRFARDLMVQEVGHAKLQALSARTKSRARSGSMACYRRSWIGTFTRIAAVATGFEPDRTQTQPRQFGSEAPRLAGRRCSAPSTPGGRTAPTSPPMRSTRLVAQRDSPALPLASPAPSSRNRGSVRYFGLGATGGGP